MKTFSTLAHWASKCASICTINKNRYYLFSIILLFTLGVGSMWGATWEKATSIAAGDVVLLVCESKKMELSSISTTSTKYGIGTAYTTTPAGLYELTVEAGSSNGTFSFKNGSAYLYWTSGNSLASYATKSANTSWTVTFSNGNATIKNAEDVTRIIGWNASSPRFACYTSSQTAVQLYKKVTAAPSYTITAQSNNTSYGTVSLSGTTITATPKTGYRVSTTTPFTISPSGSATVTQNGNTFTVVPTANTTITINFEAIPTYTINWYVNGTKEHSQTAITGTTLTNIPNLDDYECGGKVFVGWTTQSGYSNATTAPNGMITSTSGMTMPEGGEDYYAVFAEPGGTSTTSWVKTDISDIKSTDDVLITMTKSTSIWALNSNNGASKAPTANVVTQQYLESGEDADDLLWNISKDGSNNLTIYPKNSTSTWLYCTNTNDGVRVGTNTNKIFTISENYLKHTATSRYVGVYITNPDWRCYDNTTGNIANQTLAFYKKATTASYQNYTTTCDPETPATELIDAQFAWSAATAEATMGATNTFPTLTNTVPVSVTYESSNTAAATIAADGTITLVAPGTTTISAKFAGGEVSGTTYAAKTVEYTLTVKKAPLAPIAGGVIDILNQEWTDVSGTNYKDVAEKTAENTGHSNAKYVAQCAGDKSSIQLRSNNSNSGVVSTVSGGIVKRVEVEWQNETSSGRVLQIYGSNTAYTAATDLYDDAKKGTLLGEVTMGGDETVVDYTQWTGDYKYIGFRSKSGAMYLTTVTITWLPTISKVTIADPIENGSVSVSGAADLNSVVAGTVLTLTATPVTDYKLSTYDVYKTDDATVKVTVNGNTFVMPEFDVTISATFVAAKTLTSIEITTAATQTTFWQGETFNYTGLVVTAHFDGAADEVVTPTVTGSTATAGTQTVTVSYTEGTTTKTATYTITVKAIPNTKETAYSVADAYDIIDKLTTAEGVFISGIISQVDSYNSTYKSITYWISADGTTTKQLEVYSGKGLESADFAAVTDLSVGDQVIVCGNLKIYNSIYEFDKNNYLASHTPTTKDPAGLEYATTEYTANINEAFTAPILTNPNGLTVTYSTSDATLATVNATTGAVTILDKIGKVTITASSAADATYAAGSASYNITITDPSLAVAQLPFTYNSGKADIETTAGITQEGLGSDYTSAGSPKLKFDHTGDNIVICFDSQADELSYDIKGNPGQGTFSCTFAVQESEDGSTYTDLVTYTTLETTTTNKTDKLAPASRYVKFVFTEKSNGNVALGNISITKPDLRQEAGIAWSAESTTITIGDAFTAPTLSNPNGLTLTCTSDNENLATVTDAGAISLVSGKTGTATITATYAGNETYKPAEVTTTIIVNPKTGDVVILAKHQGKWYAMKAEYPTIEGSEKTDRLAAVPVYYVNGKLYNVSEENKDAITWTRSAYGDNKVSFQNNGKYLKGKSSTTLILEEDEDGLYKWDAADNTMLIGETTRRTFLYHKDGFFRNYSIILARETSPTYSDFPVVTAPEFATGNVYTINASATNGTAKGADTYVEGSTVTLMADPKMDYTFVNWTKGDEVVSTANPYVFTASEDLELVANFAKISQTSKTLSGTFSVGEYEVAQFATGNLQYNVKNKEWSFAKQQYQYIGDANINVGDLDFTGTIDLFGWSNGENNNFGANPSGNKNDYKGEFVDWGKLFPAEDNWSTLSHEQWDYLLNKRGAGKKQIARVGTVFGVMLFPDVWNAPLTVEAQYDNYFKINVYNYTLDQWTELETAGAVFFPAAGRRYGGYGNKYIYDGITNLGDEYKLQYCTNDLAAYYTSTKHNDGERVSYLLNLGNGGAKYSTLELGWYEYGHVGQSVRLAKVTDVTPKTYTRTVTNGEWGTICLPYASSSFTGATFYEVSSLVVGEGLWLDQLADGDQLVAGKPYIFQATATEIAVTYTGEEVGAPVEGANGLTGTFADIAAGGLTGNYIIAENKVWVAGTGATLSANRAYINAEDVPTTAQAQLPGRRRVQMGENAATGLDNITNGENTVIKTIENGQLIIIRDGIKYNAQGQRL